MVYETMQLQGTVNVQVNGYAIHTTLGSKMLAIDW